MSKNTDIMLGKQFIIEFYQEFDDFDFEKRYLQYTYAMLKTKEFQEFTKKTTGTWDVIPEVFSQDIKNYHDNSSSQLNDHSNTTRLRELEGTSTKKELEFANSEPLSLHNKSAKSSQKITISEDNTPPPIQASNAILHLYQPCKVHYFTHTTKLINPYTTCDTHGCGTLYNSKKAIKCQKDVEPCKVPILTRKITIPGTPIEYENLYKNCWNKEDQLSMKY
ncbi:hypothetical protein GLOIN_2v1701688 [Rhizophagus irregularis DAOM 181602=DAOM 197198]|nr:hypothetical protein GLOIN_2v1701688 [Rhizophagus irregularis DAOM 181602=DAOM 197198]